MAPMILMTDPAHFDVSYAINPWMKPSAWLFDPDGHRNSARLAWEALRSALVAAGAQIHVVAGSARLARHGFSGQRRSGAGWARPHGPFQIP